ncbi:MAG: FAD:protein FMN transferase [Flavobacteriales bacterium]
MILGVDSWPRRIYKAAVPLAALLFVVGMLNSCGSRQNHPEFVHWGETQGTTYLVKYLGVDSVPQLEIDAILQAVDEAANLWMPESAISRVNRWNRTDTVFSFVDKDLIWSVIWDRSVALHEVSGGAFDPTVQPLVELWGFGLSKRREVKPEDVEEVMAHVGMDWSRIDMNEVFENKRYLRTEILKRDSLCGLDFNSIAQGYTVDLLADLLLMKGIDNFMVEVGGEVKCHGINAKGTSWRIAIDKPTEDWSEGRQLEAIVDLNGAAICTSGNYRKFYMEGEKRRSHAIDPRTGYPVDHGLLSVTIRSVDASTADGLATACMVMGPEEGKAFIMTYREEHPEEHVEALFIVDDEPSRHWLSPGWAGTLTFVEKPS